ncbi:hypothetical protein BGZ96_011233 [Linnemannia gamsii]|uniref:Cas12f1-like TNB domain-containing protein n=1 Tax=Linnemannia gamsii TaxID=64522 RepID=A0ABQ7JT04_9FUNG|nr:hypothetical protein BGZ96_011233 [Linnemannia gamsii]
MGSIADSMPEFGYPALQGYVNRRIAFNKAAASARDRGIPCSQAPPVFPMNSHSSSRYVINNFIRTDGMELQVLAYDTRHRYQHASAFDPVMRIEKVLPDHATIMRIFNDQTPKCIGWDPGELVSAALCMIHHADNWDRQPEAQDPPLSNLLIRRSALYSPTKSARADRERLKNRSPAVQAKEAITGDLWVQEQDSTAATLRLPSISDMESALPSKEQYTVDEFEQALLVRLSMEPLLREVYSTSRFQKDRWAEKRAKRAELHMAVDAILRMCGPEPCSIAVGNGTFRTGFNLASKHECFKTHFAKKARALGHVVVLVDEFLTSTMCPSCAAHDVRSRVAKPTQRSCVCVECGRWINRDSVGAQNIALIAERWMTDQTRPLPLERPAQPSQL